MRRRKTKTLPSDSSSDEEPLSTISHKAKIKKPSLSEDSSSESDIEKYLQPANKIDLTSPFFNANKESSSVDNSEGLGGPRRIESDSEHEEEQKPNDETSATTFNFGQFYEFTKKVEEAKKYVEESDKKKEDEKKDLAIDDLLKVGESKIEENENEKKEVKNEEELNSSDFESLSETEKEGWEEVGEKPKEAPVSKEGIEITVNMPTNVKKKKSVDLMATIKRRINRIRKENQVLVHKVHLLCWIAHGNSVNSKINSQNVLGVALSLLPSEKCYPPDRTDLNYLEQIVKWFKNTVTLVDKKSSGVLEKDLEAQISKKQAFDKKMLVYIFIAVLRSLGIQCRLVLSLQVEPLRPPESQLHSLSTKNNSNVKLEASTSNDAKKSQAKSNGVEESQPSTSKDVKRSDLKSTSSKKTATNKKPQAKQTTSTKESPTKTASSKPVKKKTSVEVKKTENEKEKVLVKATTRSSRQSLKPSASKDSLKVEEKPKTRSKSEASLKPLAESKSRSKSTNSEKAQKPKTSDKTKPPESVRKLRSQKLTIPQVDGASDISPPKPNLKNLKKKQPSSAKIQPKRLKKQITKYADTDSEDEFTEKSPTKKDPPKPNLKKLTVDVRNDVVNLVKNSIKEKKEAIKSKMVRKRKSAGNESEDSDYIPEPIKKRHDSDEEFDDNKIKVKRRVQVKNNVEEKKKKQGNDIWVEVFLESEEKWISVDVIKGQIHCVKELFNRASHPVSYILAWNNNNKIKDVTARYCMNFNTVTRKLRIDQNWWEQSLKPFTGTKTARDKEEDEELERLQLEKPLPTTISEYKNHPLYVLKRHLLKFEALYPPDPPPLGFIRNEPVYSRQCVYVLHSREIWLKHAKVVKPGEQPYKIVKARPKWDRLSNAMITDQMLEVFGPWQTQDYEPPTAENGIVPRNAFGNVELFKPCMLPKKTVHLKLPGLNKVAKKLNIDCAAALVGFDFHGGWNHPTYDGYIVCEEFADALTEAWEKEQEEIEIREQEKIDKRVYGNWKRLIRGLLIRERLKAKYEFGETSKKSGKAPKFATKKKH